jgi:hypothetical protein
MSALSFSRSDRIALWLDRLNRFSQSSHSVASFCATEGISTASFYQWKRRLRPSVERPKPVARRRKPATSAPARFVEMEIRPVAGCLRVSLPGNVTIELGDRLDAVAAVVREVLLAAQHTASAEHTTSEIREA